MDINATLGDISETWTLSRTYPMVALLSISYATIFVAGLIGNCVVFTIVVRNHHMRSVTNIFICNLSAADLLVTIFVEPLTLLQNIFAEWHWGETACWCVPYLQGISVCASSLSLLIIALDRYLAICFPMRRVIRKSLAKVIIAVIWLVSAALFIPWAYFFRLSKVNGQTACLEFWPSVLADRVFFLGVVTLLVYTLPVAVMCYCYCSIIYKIWHRVPKQAPSNGPETSGSSKQLNGSDNSRNRSSLLVANEKATTSDTCYTERRTDTRIEHDKPTTKSYFSIARMIKKKKPKKDKSRQVRLQAIGGLNRVKTIKIVKMLSVVVINFGICWLPLFTIFNIIKFSPILENASLNSTTPESPEPTSLFLKVVILVVPFAQLLGSANSCVNPWIYCFYSKRYRRGFKMIFLCESRGRQASRLLRPNPPHFQFNRDHNLGLRTELQHA